jgi:hypothetical protein
MRIAALALGTWLAVSAPHVERTEAFAEAKAAAVKELIDDIGKYANWCTGVKLFKERDRAWLVVLSFDPQNVEAFKGLGYKRNDDGTWEPDPRRLAPKDRAPEKLKEAPARWAKTVAGYRDRILQLTETYADELGEEGKARVLAELLALNPDDAVLHERNGEALLDGVWVLRETAAAKKRRPELKAIVAEALRAAPAAEPIEPDALERSLGIDWTATVGTPLVRVLTTGDEAEARRAAQAAHAAGVLFQATLGARPTFPEPMRMFLLAKEGDKASFLGKHPGLDAGTRRFWERIEGAGVPQTGDFCYWATTPAKRLDGVIRILLGWLDHQVYGLTPDIGWIHEGFGIYLTRELLGTRLNWFALPEEGTTTAEHNALLAKMYSSDVNWMNEAYEMLKGERPPRFATFMKKDVAALTARELLYSYVLAAYLLEGWPDKTPELLRRLGGGGDQAAAIQSALGMSVQELDGRVLAWLAQRR